MGAPWKKTEKIYGYHTLLLNASETWNIITEFSSHQAP